MIIRWSVAAALLGSACAAPDDGPASIDLAPEWRLAESPRVTIGVADGDERYMFRSITGARRLSSGAIIVADREPMLTMYDSNGTFIRRIGRQGSGPGEYQLLWQVPHQYRGDSIAAWDVGQRRVSIYDSAGVFGRSATITPPRTSWWRAGSIPSQSCCHIKHVFSDGSFLLEFPALIPNEPGPNRYATIELARVSFDGTMSDTVGVFRDAWYRYDANAPSRIRNIRLSYSFRYTLIGDTLYGGNGDGPWVLRVAPGQAADTVHLATTARAMTDEIIESYKQAYRDAYARMPERFEGAPDDLFDGEYAATVPAYSSVHHDDAGNLWLAQWKLPYSSDPYVFHVYTNRGRPVARVALPSDAWVAFIANDRIGLIETDELGVQYVRVYDIVRPADEGG